MGAIASCCTRPQKISGDGTEGDSKQTQGVPKAHGHHDHGEAKKLQGTHQALRLLGRGTAADTWLFRDLKNGKAVAIKLFQRPIQNYPVSAVLREIKTQAELGPGHLNLINVYEVFLTPEVLGLVMEVAEGGSLTTYVGERYEHASKNGLVLPEDEGLYLFKQFIRAVHYCHQHSIAHRDLKLDNTLLDGSDPPVLKICDFGFARHFSSPLEKTASHLGTPEYMSPELLHKTENGQHEQYDARSTDVWACGVMLLVALLGAFPFEPTDHHLSGGATDDEVDIWQQEVSKNWKESSFIAGNVAALSPEVRDLLDKIFVVNPTDRITLAQIMAHPWFKRPLPAKYQQALDRQAKQQADLDHHVQTRRIDQAKLEERNKALEKMVFAAAEPGHENPQKSGLRPLHYLDMAQSELTSLDLSEGAVLAEGSSHAKDEASPVVRERFTRGSVAESVENVFKSDSREMDGVREKMAERNRMPVGGGII